MFKQVFIPILAAIAFIVGVGIFLQRSSTFFPPASSLPPSTTSPTPTTTPGPLKSISVNGKKIYVEIASTPEAREKGLSGRSFLASDSGMLFTFGTTSISPIFWMKDMLIPLDFIWIKDGKVLKIDKNIQPPAPNTPDNQLPEYAPGTPIDYVLEVNAGFCDQNGISVGSPVDLSQIQP